LEKQFIDEEMIVRVLHVDGFPSRTIPRVRETSLCQVRELGCDMHVSPYLAKLEQVPNPKYSGNERCLAFLLAMLHLVKEKAMCAWNSA